ncbi:helix-turn-helix transcriptional regulator [Flagellimonas oceanensis]|uniref:helix-turn-helix transcriptional regulator n=1 Tax=Flagellimonas oceanensis TaxID=2499163 RepID=UPI001F3BA540|nr:helix-turn-helix transcriptional regulator [Allomuricauda oceanensis]
MVISLHNPEKPLDILFKECYYIHLDHEGGTGRIPVIDDCCYDLVFFKEAAGIFYYGENPKKVAIKNKVFTIHNVTPPYRIEGAGALTFFTIKLQPWVNAHFFSSLQNEGVVDISKFDSQLLPFYQQVFAIDEVSGKFSLADDFMNKNLFELTPSMEFVKEICGCVYESQGKITVNQLSEHFNRSRQYLGKVFKKEVMYSLKKFIITVRILDLVKHKAKNPDISLTHLSYDYGYFDQPHFINDFKKVCGVNPLQFFNNLPEFLLRHQ